MDVFASCVKSCEVPAIRGWLLLPMAIAVALFLPPLLLSVILNFILVAAILSPHFSSYTLLGRTLAGRRANMRPRGPPIS